jgi:hypothetical protein
MNEAKMTDADMAQREKIVKSMKKNFKDFRSRYGARAKEVMYATATKMAMKESHYPTQGSSVEYPMYKEMDMENLVQDAIKEIPEDDGPHTSDISDTDAINFQTVAKPEDVVNQSSNEGNREFTPVIASRKTGKPFKSIRSRGPMSYGPEDLSGAVAGVAIGESVDEADKGEYDYEGDMAKSSLKTIIRNAQLIHDMLSEDTNLPEWVQGKITLAEDYIVSAAQYMQSEMSEQVELDEISKETAWKAVEKAHTKVTTSAYGAIGNREPYLSKFKKNLKQQSKFMDYYKKKKAAETQKEEVDLEEGETKKMNKAMKNQYHMEKGAAVRKAFKNLRPSGKNLPHSANVRTGRLLDRDKTGTILNLKSGIDPRPGVGFNKKMKEEVEMNEGSYDFNPGYESKNKRIQKKAEAGMKKNWKQYAKNTQLPRSQRRSALIATDPKQVKKSEWGKHGNRYVKHAFGPYMGESTENTPVKKEETPKKKYKKMRSQERFDARFKEVDTNYPYRSDN